MKRYNVLWIDDEVEKQDGFLEVAYLEGLNITPFKTSKLGMTELKSKIEFYDAVILDAMVYYETEDEKAGLAGLQNSIKTINSFANTKKIPYFIFSGYIDKDEHSSAREMLANEKIFIKSKDNKELFIAIKTAADQQFETQIKHENALLFDVLNHYPADVGNLFINAFKGLKQPNYHFDDQLYFNKIRISLETMFRKANKLGLLHDDCVKKNGNQVNLTESSLFLAGLNTKHLKVNCSITHFPKIIADNVYNILKVTGAVAHTAEVDITKNIDFQAYRKEINTPYLFYSLAFQLMDVLIWFDQYAKANNDININKSYWLSIASVDENDFSEEQWIEGEVINLNAKGFAFLSPTEGEKNHYIPKELVAAHNLTNGKVIKGIIEEYPDNTTGESRSRVTNIYNN